MTPLPTIYLFFFSNIPSHYWHCSIAINTIRIILSSRWNLLPWTPNDKSDLMISVVCPETKLTVLFIVAVLWLIIVSSPYKLWRSEWKSKSKLNYDFAHSPIITEVTRIQSKCLNDENWKLYRRRILEMARSENSIHERFNIPVIDIRLNDNRQTIAFDYWLTSRILIPISDLTKFDGNLHRRQHVSKSKKKVEQKLKLTLFDCKDNEIEELT